MQLLTEEDVYSYRNQVPLNQGRHSVTYNFKDDKVIKFSKYRAFSDKNLKIFKIMQKNPNVFAKVFRVGPNKDWIIQEKLDTKRAEKNFESLATAFYRIGVKFGLDEDTSYWGMLESHEYPQIEAKIKASHPTIYKFMVSVRELFDEAMHLMPDQELDFTDHNVGYDDTNKLKLLDI